VCVKLVHCKAEPQSELINHSVLFSILSLHHSRRIRLPSRVFPVFFRLCYSLRSATALLTGDSHLWTCVIDWLSFHSELLIANHNLPLQVVALHHLLKGRRTKHPSLKSSSNASLSSTQYYRLMVMSMLLGIWNIVWTVLLLATTTQFGYSPLPDWQSIHENMSTILQFPMSLMYPSLVSSYEFVWWAIPSAAFLLAAFFCTSRDVMSEYYKFWIWVKTKVVGPTFPGGKKGSTSSLVQPSECVDVSPHQCFLP